MKESSPAIAISSPSDENAECRIAALNISTGLMAVRAVTHVHMSNVR
jgi:hypothetical protein